MEDIQRKDKTKRELAEAKGITLVTIPFWWDGKTSRYHLPQFTKKYLNVPQPCRDHTEGKIRFVE